MRAYLLPPLMPGQPFVPVHHHVIPRVDVMADGLQQSAQYNDELTA